MLMAQLHAGSMWQALREFNGHDFLALMVGVLFVVGTPLVLGIAAKLLAWTAGNFRLAMNAFERPDAGWEDELDELRARIERLERRASASLALSASSAPRAASMVDGRRQRAVSRWRRWWRLPARTGASA